MWRQLVLILLVLLWMVSAVYSQGLSDDKINDELSKIEESYARNYDKLLSYKKVVSESSFESLNLSMIETTVLLNRMIVKDVIRLHQLLMETECNDNLLISNVKEILAEKLSMYRMGGDLFDLLRNVPISVEATNIIDGFAYDFRSLEPILDNLLEEIESKQ